MKRIDMINGFPVMVDTEVSGHNSNEIDDVVRCPHCNSARVFELRIDSDWGSGIGNYYPANDEDKYNEYTKEDLELDSYDRPDIDLYHCLNCGYMWEG